MTTSSTGSRCTAAALALFVALSANGFDAAAVHREPPARDAVGVGADARDDWADAERLERTDLDAAARSAIAALRSDTGALDGPRQALAFRIGTGLAERGDVALAVRVQVPLHDRVRADWSAINAAISLVKLGRSHEAEDLLAEHEPRARSRADIANHRGLAAMGHGDERAARRHFARALVRGSRDAGLSLARLDLVAGHEDRARAGFRPSIDDARPHAWALRGWALTLLP